MEDLLVAITFVERQDGRKIHLKISQRPFHFGTSLVVDVFPWASTVVCDRSLSLSVSLSRSTVDTFKFNHCVYDYA